MFDLPVLCTQARPALVFGFRSSTYVAAVGLNALSAVKLSVETRLTGLKVATSVTGASM